VPTDHQNGLPESGLSAPSGTMTRRQYREALQAQRQAARAARRRKVKALTVQLPQLGIVGALGLSTVVVPLVSGGGPLVKVADAAVAADSSSQDPAGQAAPAGPTGAPSASPSDVPSADAFSVVPGDGSSTDAPLLASGPGKALPVDQLLASRQEAERASRDLVRTVLPGCDGVVHNTAAENGRLDVADLCALWEPGDYLRADAAVALAELNAAYQQRFGAPLVVTDSYRSYEQQVSVRARKPGLAARPGTSEHGWALAVDLGGGIEAADEHHQWMRENAPRFGWDNPDWARSGGSGPYEPWHWEYVAGQPAVQG
jgi:D-alanyl-D-alanine carboxypeptidase